MASKTITVSPAGAISAGCSAMCDSYYSGVKPPSYQGDVTLAYTNYQVVATGVGNWRPKRIKVTHFRTYSDGTTSSETITYRSSNYGDANPWSFPAVKEFSNWENPFEYTETDPGTVWQLRTIDDTITGIEVEFEESTPPTSYTITTAVSPVGSGTTTGGGTFNSGASCTLTATPASGYSFVRWEKNGVQVSTSSSYTFTVSESATYTAIFESATPLVHIQVVAFNGFYVTLNGIYGTTSSAWTVAEGDFTPGDSITIAASAPNPTLNPFKAWYLNPSAWGNPEQTGTLVPGAGATYTFTASANATYFATFNYPTTIYLDTRSTLEDIVPAPDAVVSANGRTDGTNEFVCDVVPGSSVTIEATEYGGEVDISYFHSWVTKLYFSKWQDRYTGTTVSTNRQYTFTTIGQSTAYNLRAIYSNFAPLHTAVMPNASTGTITASPLPRDGNYFEYWTDVTLTATPSAGFKFVKWTAVDEYGRETDVTTNNQCTIEIDDDIWDTTYRAYFEWDGTNLLVNSANLGSPVRLVYDPATNKLIADY